MIDWSPDGDYAQIYFVDEGHTDVIKVAEETLYPLDALNDVFNNYPHQAVRVSSKRYKHFFHLNVNASVI